MPSRILADIARKSGGKLLNDAIGRILPTASKGSKGNLLSGIAGAAAVRIATRSVPGALAVGGALLAKTLYDRRRTAQAKAAAKLARSPAKDRAGA
jgi:hypothetical protein